MKSDLKNTENAIVFQSTPMKIFSLLTIYIPFIMYREFN